MENSRFLDTVKRRETLLRYAITRLEEASYSNNPIGVVGVSMIEVQKNDIKELLAEANRALALLADNID